MDDLDTGVQNQEETDTSAVTPDSEQTTQTDEVADTSEATASTEESRSAEKYVPYSRFKEINDELKQIREELGKQTTPPASADPQAEQVKQTLKQYGFMAKEDVDAELKKLREDTALERRLSSLESNYSGKDGRPKFDRSKVVEFAINHQIADPEVAYKAMHEKELIDWHIRQAAGKTAGVKVEKSDGSGTTSIGASNDDLKEAAMSGDDAAFTALMKRTRAFKGMFNR